MEEIRKRTNAKGYIEVEIDGEWILEHRYIIEEKLGRSLLPDEVVHHKDENKQNNHISNLMIMSKAQHASLHKTNVNTVKNDVNLDAKSMSRTSSKAMPKNKIKKKTLDEVDFKLAEKLNVEDVSVDDVIPFSSETLKPLYSKFTKMCKERSITLKEGFSIAMINELRVYNNDIPVLIRVVGGK